MQKITPFLLCTLILLASCSLDYGKNENSEDAIPEFTFADAVFSRYEDNKQTMQITAEKIEQYKSNGASYARGAAFRSFDDDGNLDTEGSCDLMAADTKKEVYTMFRQIFVTLHSQDLKIHAESLRFDGKNEQIVGSIDDEVQIEKKDTVIVGKGFSASGVSNTFSFLSAVDGTVQTNDTPDRDDSTESGDTDGGES